MITFREFLLVCEKKTATPPQAVPGTYNEVDGVKTYTLAPYEGPSGPLKTKKKVKKVLDKQGGIGGGAIKKAKKKADKINKIGEDLEQLRRNLETLERQSAPAQRLTARRRAALERTRQIHKAEKQRQREYKEAQARKRGREHNEELQLEQTPHMTPTPFNVAKAQAQAKGGVAHRRHVHQEIGAEARAQEAAKQRRLKAIMSR